MQEGPSPTRRRRLLLLLALLLLLQQQETEAFGVSELFLSPCMVCLLQLWTLKK